MVFEKIAEFLATHTGMDVSDIQRETTFESLGIDSLDTVEMVMELEEAFNMDLEIEDRPETVGALSDLVTSMLEN